MDLIREANYQTRTISEDNNSYSIDGMMKPTFYNEGTSTVIINNLKIAPGQNYIVDTPQGFVSIAAMNIQFDNADGSLVNSLILNYHTVGEPFTDSVTGKILTESQRRATASCIS
tara:strand:+ start:417 stop:761 length:345 start_codon:yes stop_codon:yes gene_type:complete